MRFSKLDFDFDVEEFDDHEIHIKTHIAYLLSGDGVELRKDKNAKDKVLEHIRKHKQFNKLMEA